MLTYGGKMILKVRVNGAKPTVSTTIQVNLNPIRPASCCDAHLIIPFLYFKISGL